MALYSVWDWEKNMYAVFATDKPVSVGVDPDAPRPRGIDVLGGVPYEDVKVLPAGARLLGHDRLARGEIVRASRGVLGLGDAGQPAEPRTMSFAVVAIGGVVAGYALARATGAKAGSR